MSRPFRFKMFEIVQEVTPMKVGTDGVLLGAWAEGGQRILDVGTGTGLVALMMAERFADAEVTGIDICDEAVEEAIYNVSRSPFAERVRIEKADFREMRCNERFDAVVCNPPYFERSLKCPSEGRSMARHSDSLSIDELVRGARGVLTDDGVLTVVLPYTACDEATEAGLRYGFSAKKMMRVRGNATGEWKRILICMALGCKGECIMEEMTLEKERGIRTTEYQELTEDFYL